MKKAMTTRSHQPIPTELDMPTEFFVYTSEFCVMLSLCYERITEKSQLKRERAEVHSIRFIRKRIFFRSWHLHFTFQSFNNEIEVKHKVPLLLSLLYIPSLHKTLILKIFSWSLIDGDASSITLSMISLMSFGVNSGSFILAEFQPKHYCERQIFW